MTHLRSTSLSLVSARCCLNFARSLTGEFCVSVLERPPCRQGSENIASLRAILDANNTGYVNVYKFAAFLDGFGPLRNCVDNVEAMYDDMDR